MNNSRPLVTFANFTFNQEKFVRPAVEAALALDYSPLVIRVSDDASSDSTFEIVQEVCKAYKGPHTVICTKNNANLGISKHVSKVNPQAEGELLVLGAGDDVSVPSRVSKIVACYLKGERRSHYFCSSVRGTDIHGNLPGKYQSPGHAAKSSIVLSGLCSFPISIGAAEGWTKTLIDSFPPMKESVWAEDQVNGIRIYHQRRLDAMHLKRYDFEILIWIKVMVLSALLTVSPLLSILRRNLTTQRFCKYL